MSNYVISLAHTGKKNEFITLWRPENAGYCWSKELAGTYESPEIGYHESDTNTAISSEVAERLFLKLHIEGKEHERIPNCKPVWDALGVKMGKFHLIKVAK